MIPFLAQFVTMLCVTSNVHATMAHNPIKVAGIQGIIGIAWVLNVNAVARGGWRLRALYILGGMAGAAAGTWLA